MKKRPVARFHISRIWLVILLVTVSGILASCGERGGTSGREKGDGIRSMEEASKEPYGKYPELVTYTLGKLAGDNNSNLPEGDTYEDNAYTRYLRELLNVQNKDVFEAADYLYDNMVSMAITDDELPDIMIVQERDTLKDLAENGKLEDLTESYETCASSRIKDIYDSYGEDLLELATIDGRLMAIPGTNIQNGPNLLWLRKDWMDKLGLKAPKNLEEAEEIIRQFVEKDPGGNGEGKTVGLVFNKDEIGDGDKCYALDIIFSRYGAFPKKWVKDASGQAVYSSATENAKDALAHLRRLYKKGVLDNQFLVRTTANIDSLIVNGKCGSFFAPWWAPNNPLMKAYENNPEADWQPYLIPTKEDGTVTTYTQDITDKYIVVRKGFEHPEIAVKIINVLFDYTRYIDMENEEMQSYYSLNVDPTARPLAVNVDYNDALFRTTESIKKALAGEKPVNELITIEKSYYSICRDYFLHKEKPSAEEWAGYMSRIVTVDILADAKIEYLEPFATSETATMRSEGWNLELLEKEAYLKIISGEEGLDYFDSFVTEWKERGGDAITEEVQESLKD